MTDPTVSRTPLSVLGLGAMGAALAGTLLRAGHPTTVWNRTAAKADELVAAGAARAGSPADAVTANRLVIACLLDDAALHTVLDPVAGELTGRTLVNLTSGTPDQARATAQWAAAHGIEYLDGKILAFPSTIGRPEAFVLYAGAQEVFAAHEPALSALATSAHVGPDAGLASLYDLGLLNLMYGLMTGFLHSLALLRADGVAPEAFLPYATSLVRDALPGFISGVAEQVSSGDYASGEAQLDMQVAYLGHMVDVSEARGVDPTFPAYVKALMERAVAAGHGGDDVGRLLDELAAPVPTS